MTTTLREPAPAAEGPLLPPSSSGGLVDVFRRRYLLRLLVRKEIQARYSGSFLGLLWSYILPLVRFCMYFFVIGLVLGLHKSVPNFAIHMFSAIVFVSYFTETFSSGTRSIVRNKAIVRKMAMPREMFPVSAVIVSAIHTFPQLLILFVGAVATGWSPDLAGILAGLLGAAIITVFGTSLALVFSAANVFFRDFQNIVATFTIFIHWAVPMIYPFAKLKDSASMGGTWIEQVYLANPLSEAVLLMQRCFWIPTTPHPRATAVADMPADLFPRGLIMLAVSFCFLALCQRVFSKLEGKFAERL